MIHETTKLSELFQRKTWPTSPGSPVGRINRCEIIGHSGQRDAAGNVEEMGPGVQT